MILTLLFSLFTTPGFSQMPSNTKGGPRTAQLTKTLTSQICLTERSQLEVLKALYAEHFHKWDTHSNMLWDCHGNSVDLYRTFIDANLPLAEHSYLVTVYFQKQPHLTEADWVYPLEARLGVEKWSQHTFLVIGSFVFDQYFTDKPQLMTFGAYMDRMWGKETKTKLKYDLFKLTDLIPSDYDYSKVWGTWDRLPNPPFLTQTYNETIETLTCY